jgi:hypothetical protein
MAGVHAPWAAQSPGLLHLRVDLGHGTEGIMNDPKTQTACAGEVGYIGPGKCDRCHQEYDYVITLSGDVKLCRGCAESETPVIP